MPPLDDDLLPQLRFLTSVILDAARPAYSLRQEVLVIVEMLRAALEGEPQVAVATHFYREAPGAVFIPQEVRVDLSLVDQSREFFDISRYRAMLLTTVKVYGDHVLKLRRRNHVPEKTQYR